MLIYNNDPYWNSTVLLLRSNGTTAYDLTGKSSISITGSIPSNNTYKNFGLNSLQFSNGNYITISSSTNLGMGTGDWTIDFQVYLTNGQVTIYDARTIDQNAPSVYTGYPSYWRSDATGVSLAGGTASTGAWYYVMNVRKSGVQYIYVNGTQVASATDTNNWGASRSMWIGRNLPNNNWMNGYISEFRITKGVARPNIVPFQPLIAY